MTFLPAVSCTICPASPHSYPIPGLPCFLSRRTERRRERIASTERQEAGGKRVWHSFFALFAIACQAFPFIMLQRERERERERLLVHITSVRLTHITNISHIVPHPSLALMMLLFFLFHPDTSRTSLLNRMIEYFNWGGKTNGSPLSESISSP